MDPYSVHKGLFYAHYGWVILRRKPEQTGPANLQDIDADPIVQWQRRNYILILILTAFIFPTFVCGLLFNDFTGGFIYASCLRVFMAQQRTFCINSLAHWVGERPYSEKHSPRDNWIIALITLGEGYHNFHHEFPMDYRNGYHWSAYDPTKWFIWLCSFVRLSFDLKKFPENEIQKGLFQQTKSELDRKEKVISWGQPLDELPVLSRAQYADSVRNGHSLIVIDGVAHDVSDFISHHPGGKALLWKNIGKDVTKMFHGDVYAHSNAATNLLSTMRFAMIVDSAGESS
jgi:stearoyl-CoA desaturase (Delta-9 desaturase)